MAFLDIGIAWVDLERVPRPPKLDAPEPRRAAREPSAVLAALLLLALPAAALLCAACAAVNVAHGRSPF